jgi:hypothetical protein
MPQEISGVKKSRENDESDDDVLNIHLSES